MMFMRNRRGEEFVEAAIVLPLMILTILSMILIAVFLYSHEVRQSDTHVELMKEAAASKSVFAVKRKSVSTSKNIRGTYTSGESKSNTFRAYAMKQADAVRIGSLAGDNDAE